MIEAHTQLSPRSNKSCSQNGPLTPGEQSTHGELVPKAFPSTSISPIIGRPVAGFTQPRGSERPGNLWFTASALDPAMLFRGNSSSRSLSERGSNPFLTNSRMHSRFAISGNQEGEPQWTDNAQIVGIEVKRSWSETLLFVRNSQRVSNLPRPEKHHQLIKRVFPNSSQQILLTHNTHFQIAAHP